MWLCSWKSVVDFDVTIILLTFCSFVLQNSDSLQKRLYISSINKKSSKFLVKKLQNLSLFPFCRHIIHLHDLQCRAGSDLCFDTYTGICHERKSNTLFDTKNWKMDTNSANLEMVTSPTSFTCLPPSRVKTLVLAIISAL